MVDDRFAVRHSAVEGVGFSTERLSAIGNQLSALKADSRAL
jgi:hypothetical protein